jgi:poly(A) polymerase
MTRAPSLADQPWLHAPEVRAVMAALGNARFVGGCVRNSLLGLGVDDIDIATPLTPDAVAKAVERQGMRAVATGLEHGTVTVVCNSKPFEVTTLRRDVSTDGRRATVAFTTDWQEDAGRRDFTINALYADAQGQVFDYHGGLEDLKAGVVRFIGDADARIAEDYLRVLRLFRIHAWYGRGEINAVALTACAAARHQLKTLSGERLQKEVLKLLLARAPLGVVRSMQASGVLGELIPGAIDTDALGRMCEIDSAHGLAADPVLRLAVMLDGAATAHALAVRWRFSNNDRDRLADVFRLRDVVKAGLPGSASEALVYRHGNATVRDLARVGWVHAQPTPPADGWLALMRLAETWQRPRLPIDGADILKAGVPHGPAVGKTLHAVEEWWIASGFPDSRERALEKLSEVLRRA